jgi:hypothetical protein
MLSWTRRQYRPYQVVFCERVTRIELAFSAWEAATSHLCHQAAGVNDLVN